MKEVTRYISDDGLEFSTLEEAQIQDAVFGLVCAIRNDINGLPAEYDDYELARWILEEQAGFLAELIEVVDGLKVKLKEKGGRGAFEGYVSPWRINAKPVDTRKLR